MARLSNEERDILHALIEEYGEAFLQEYINQKFAPVIIKLRRIGVHNADDWIDIESFTEWIISASQKSARPSTPAVPTSSMPLRSLSNMPVSSPASAFRTPIKSKTTPNYRAPSSSLPPSSPPGSTPPSSTVPYRLPSVPIYVSDPTPPPVSALLQEKRKRQPTTASDEVIIVEQPQSPRPKHKKKKKKDSNMIDITRQKRVRELVTIDHPPVYFDVPKNTEDRAYLLDLTEQRDEPAFLDDEGEPRSMAWIVLKHNHDAFATRKSKSRKCNVVALDTECHAIEFSCSGTYVCDRFDATTLQNYERFKAKEGEQNELFGMERDMSEHSTQSLAARAVAFYHDTMTIPCINENCTGIPTYRPFKSVKHNYDGKTGFVGCSGWRVGDQKGDHRFTPIPRQHNERIIQHLFAHNGQLDPNDVTENDKQECTRMQAPRNGGKGAKLCPYPHISSSNKAVQGKMVARVCPARGTIYAPVDSSDRRAIIILHNVPHNHPAPPPMKTTPIGEHLYAQAAEKVHDKKMLRVDMAPTTKDVFGSRAPSSVDPGLSSSRKKRDIIRSVREKAHPHGLGWEGLAAMSAKERSELNEDARYIHAMLDEGDTRIVVTMLKEGAALLLKADASYHDNTYKRTAGDWKEWEVVVWCARLNRRVTVARIYCTHETRRAFAKIWRYVWDTAERLTGERMKFHFLDGSGLKAIIVDGDKRQVEGLGDDLAERCLKSDNPVFAGKKQDPLEIVTHCLKTCITHFERKVDALAIECPPDVISEVRRCQFVTSQDELDELVRYYKSSPYKCIRDWIADKDQSPWFFGSINEHLSAIPEREWYETDMTTNINESAHPYTNQMTGTGKPLVESIMNARDADRMVFEQLKQCEANGVLINSHNTFADRTRSNRLRHDSRLRVAAERSAKSQELAKLNDVIKDAQQKKKALAQEGVKAPRAKKGSRGKDTPNSVEMRLPSSPVSPSPARAAPLMMTPPPPSPSFSLPTHSAIVEPHDMYSTSADTFPGFGDFTWIPSNDGWLDFYPTLPTVQEDNLDPPILPPTQAQDNLDPPIPPSTQAPIPPTPLQIPEWTPWTGAATQASNATRPSHVLGSAMQSLAAPPSTSTQPGGAQSVYGWCPADED